DFDADPVTPERLRWSPMPMPTSATDFIEGLFTLAGNGGPATGTGIGVHLYAANRDMTDRFFCNADAELLIVPQSGRLRIATELGTLDIEPQEIAVVPRGIRFQVSLPDGSASGYVCENFGALLQLPDLGPIGSNGLANPRDFLTPCAAYEDREGDFSLLTKFQGRLWRAPIHHSPLDVVAWHGNYAPYKYDLRRFNTIGSISYDHPDPSIFLVLHSPSDTAGVSNLDFVIFPPRWLVAQGHAPDMRSTFRRYLTRGNPGYVEHEWTSLENAVGWIRASGGMAVIAHPGRYAFNARQLHLLLDAFRALGGEGIEVITGSHHPSEYGKFADLARAFGLKASRGADFHAPGEGIDIGRLPALPHYCQPVWQGW
ncbi:MAG: hypothetical protein CVV17_11210, partial [Gammaproteobacteria bacterium HGW-Gammaproteobacteria-7]